MSDPFLSLPGAKRKRPSRSDIRTPRQDKRQDKRQTRNELKSHSKRRLRDTSPRSADDDEIGPGAIETDIDLDSEQSDENENDETPAERRLRLAKEYLDKIKFEVGIHLFEVVDFRKRF